MLSFEAMHTFKTEDNKIILIDGDKSIKAATAAAKKINITAIYTGLKIK